MQNNEPMGLSNLVNIDQLETVALNVVENFCAVITRPVEIILRPWHGSRYSTLPIIFFTNAMMIALPILSILTTSMVSMIPFVHVPPPMGLFSIGSFAKLYFLLTAIHGVRIYRLMIHPETEKHSQYEGAPLPFFQLLPRSKSFWFTRIVLEPALVFATTIVLGPMYIFTTGLAAYLQFAAMALAMKEFIVWYRGWLYIRDVMDQTYAGPIIGKLVQHEATQEDLAPLHIASFPENLPADLRNAAVAHIARVFSPDTPINNATPPKEEGHASDTTTA
jgi:hypothetical protein